MIIPETTSIRQSRWDMFIDTGLKVYDVLVGKIRRLEITDVESEAME